MHLMHVFIMMLEVFTAVFVVRVFWVLHYVKKIKLS